MPTEDELMEATPETEPETDNSAEDKASGEVDPRDAQIQELLRDKEENAKLRGKWSNEVGALRKQMQELAQRDAERERLVQSPPRDYSAELSAIQQQVDNGDISAGQGLAMVAQITSQQAKAEALMESQAMFEEQRKRDWMNQQNDKYIEMEPDYPQFAERFAAGEFDNIRQMHPYLGGDPVLAHQRWKRLEAESALKAKEEQGKEKGRKEAEKLLSGTGEAQKVLNGSGSEASRVKPQPQTMADKRAEYIRRHQETNGFSKY